MSVDCLQGFRLGPWNVEPLRGAVTGPQGETRHLEPKVMDVFVFLAEHANELVTRDELQQKVWHGRAVTDEPLTRAIGELRRALEDGGADSNYIETVPKRGYRLIGDIFLLDGTRLEIARTGSQFKGRKLAFVIVTILVSVLVYVAYDVLVIDPAQEHALISDTPDLSVAVLPFANMSPDPEQEYFADGLSEDILNLLAKISGLSVIARTSSFAFKEKNEDVREIGKTLGVKWVLEGSVRRSGDQVRIAAQLVDASDGTHIWSEIYNRTMTDIFAVQAEIATAITNALKTKLGLDNAIGEVVQPTVIKAASTDAYEAYFRARELIYLRGRKNLEEAVRHLEQALRLDDNYAPAHAQLAIAIAMLTNSPNAYGTLTLQEVLRRAIPHLDRAQELEPDLAEAHAGRALLAMASDLELSIEHARKALASNPSYTDVMNWLYMAYNILGRYVEEEAILRHMLVTDPMSIFGRVSYTVWLGNRGRVEEAHEVADQLLAQSRLSGYKAHTQTSLIWEGNIAEGLSWALRAQAEDPSDTLGLDYPVVAFIWVGEYDEARRVNDNDRLHYMVDLAEGHFEEGIRATQRRMQLDPENGTAVLAAANALYAAGRVEEALALYELLSLSRPEGRPIRGAEEMNYSANEMMMRLALARRKSGDEDAAQAAAHVARNDHTARRAAGVKDQYQHRTEAMIAAFEDDTHRMITALNAAMQHGLRDPHFFEDAIFEDVWDESAFVAIQKELDEVLTTEHHKVLQLICFNNPVPDNWQPMPETCEGVVEQLAFNSL